MLIRWFDTLIEHDFEIVHCPGILHVLPDALSRLFQPFAKKDKPDLSAVQTLLTRAALDPSRVIKEVCGKTIPPLENRQTLIDQVHNFGHFGIEATLKALWKQYNIWWPGIRKQVHTTLENCVQCQYYTIGKHRYELL